MTIAIPRRPTGLITANLLCMASMLIWAAGLPAASLIIPLLPAEQLNATRMTLAALALVPIWALVEGPGALWRAGWGKGVLVGSLIGLGAWCLVQGQARTDAVTVAVISATMPVAGIAMEVVLDGRKLSFGLVIGLSLSLLGGLMALDLANGGLSFGLGALFCLGSVLAFVLGSRLTVTAFPALSPLGRTAITLTGAAVASSAVALAQIVTGASAPVDYSSFGAREWAAMLMFSVGALGISQVLWIMSVGRLGIGLSALHINATPFYVMLILFAFGAGWNWTQALGAAVVGIGVLVAQGLIKIPLRTTDR